MKNVIFNLLQFKKDVLAANYNLQPKQAQSQKNYLLIEPKVPLVQQATLVNKSGVEYTVTDYHFSVYEDLRLKNIGLQSHYHLTINLVDQQQQPLCGRIYYYEFNKVVAAFFKNDNNELVDDFNEANVRQFAKLYTTDFANSVYHIYQELDLEHSNQYEQLITELSKQSQAAYNPEFTDETAREVYQGQLAKVIAHLEQWQLYQFNPRRQPLQLFLNLKQQINARYTTEKEKSLHLNTRSTPEYMSVESIVMKRADEPITSVRQAKSKSTKKLLDLDNKITRLKKDASLNHYAKLSQEYKLQTAQFELCEHDEEALECLVRCRDLEKLALRMLKEYLVFPNKYKNVTGAEFEPIIAMIPQLDLGCVYRAVVKNKPNILNYLLKHPTKINIDAPFTNKQVYLLPLAYEMGHTEIFQVLLQNGAFSDKQNDQGFTLLMNSCLDERIEEMLALLQAGASTTICNRMGYSAFGCLTMRSEQRGNKLVSVPPKYSVVRLFLDHAQGLKIDFMQGHSYLKGTPLLFACQNNWPKLVKLYLSHKKYQANPNVVRETDFNNALSIATFKNHQAICRDILTYSAYDLSHSCTTALSVAKEYRRKEVVALLEDYIKQHQINTEISKRQHLIAENATPDLNFHLQAIAPSLALNNTRALFFEGIRNAHEEIINRYDLQAQEEDKLEELNPQFTL